MLDQEKCIFKPAVQVIRAGKIDIVNSDPVLHNTHGFYGQRTAFNLALPDKGMRIASRAAAARAWCASSATPTAGCWRTSTSPTARTTR